MGTIIHMKLVNGKRAFGTPLNEVFVVFVVMDYKDLCIGSLNVIRTKRIIHRLIKYANIIVERGLV